MTPEPTDDPFLRLREVLGAPEPHAWRRRLRLPAGRDEARLEAVAAGRGVNIRGWLVAAPAALCVLVVVTVAAVAARPAASPASSTDARSTAGTRTPEAEAAPFHAERSPATAAPADDSAAAAPAELWPDAEATVEGLVVRRGGEEWSVGEPGDLVVLGDWDCDGEDSPAVLRPSTGGFHVFDTWAGAEAVRARSVATVAGAVGVAPAGCGRALVHLEGGGGRSVDTTPVKP